MEKDQLLKLVQTGEIPGRLIGDEWRFSRTALEVWLGHPSRLAQDGGIVVDLLANLVERVNKLPNELALVLSQSQPMPLTSDKNTLLKHQGALRDFDNMDEHLAAIRAMRESAE